MGIAQDDRVIRPTTGFAELRSRFDDAGLTCEVEFSERLVGDRTRA